MSSDGEADIGEIGGWAEAFAPGSVANVGCGLDVFGLALEEVGDVVRAEVAERPGVEIASVRPLAGARLPVRADRMPPAAGRNSAGIAARALLEAYAPGRGVRLEIRKGLPLSSGLGGSAASAVAAVVATAAALEVELSGEEALACAARGEREGSGSEAGDNVAASLLGGWALVRSTDPFDVVELPVPDGLRVALARPAVELLTADARRVLPASVPLATAVRQWANAAAVVAALHRGDPELLRRAMVDEVAEPARAHLVPAFGQVKEAALGAGALACSLSGSGPSVFALCPDEATAREAAGAMAAAFEAGGAGPAAALVSAVSAGGASVRSSGRGAGS